MNTETRTTDIRLTAAGTGYVAIFDLPRADELGKLPQAVAEAYESSRAGPVGLILGDHDPREIDRLLDPVVEDVGRDVAGVVYLYERGNRAAV